MDKKLHNEKEFNYKDNQFFEKESERLFPDAEIQTNNSQTRSDRIQREKNTGENNLYRRLEDFQPGEFAQYVRNFNTTDYFDFTSKSNKINNGQEVASLFQELQNEGVEHSFAVLVDKEKNYKPLWLTSGTINSTIVDKHAILFAANAFNAKEVYFVHNHPSGQVYPSNNDRIALKQLKEALLPFNIKVTGIIVNLTSGKYSIFNQFDVVTDKVLLDKDVNDYKPELFNFSKKTFLQKPHYIKKITGNEDASKYISAMKFSAAEKGGFLMLDIRNNIVGNIFFNKQSPEQNSKEALLSTIRYNASGIIIYGNNADFINSIEKHLTPLAKKADINLLDTIVLDTPTEIIKQTFTENINDNSSIEDLRHFSSNPDTVNEAYEKYLKGKTVDIQDAEKFLSFVHSDINQNQKNISMADYFINQISFTGDKENIDRFNKELIEQDIKAVIADNGNSIAFKSESYRPLHELIDDTVYEYNLKTFNYKFSHESDPLKSIGIYKGELINDNIESVSFNFDKEKHSELLNNIIDTVNKDAIGQAFTTQFAAEIIYNNLDTFNSPIGHTNHFIQSEIESLKKNESFINDLKVVAKKNYEVLTDFLIDSNELDSQSETKAELKKFENAFYEMEKLFPSITLQTFSDNSLKSYYSTGEEVQHITSVKEDNNEYKNRINPDGNPLTEFGRDINFIDDLFDDMDNQVGDLWKRDVDNEVSVQPTFSNEKELIDSLSHLNDADKNLALSDAWAKELSERTNLSKGMSQNQIDEKSAEYYRKYNKETLDLKPEKELTITDLAKELDTLYSQSSPDSNIHFNSKEGYKIIEFVKSLETNEDALKAVLNYVDSINNVPIKPNSKDYFSNEFIETNLTALEKYEKDLMDYTVNSIDAEKKLHQSADELWKNNIDPMNVPHVNIRETIIAMNEIFQNHNISSNLKNYTMATENQRPETNVNEQSNIKYLQDQIKYTGFKLSEQQTKELEDNIVSKKDAFTINLNNKNTNKGGVDAEINYTLNFQKSNKGDVYFFNNYDAELLKKDGTKLNHKFSITNTPGAKNFTALEAFNLLDGRYINKDLKNKEGVKANYWVGMDFNAEKNENNNYAFKMFHEKYGYDVKAALDKYGTEQTDDLIKGLEKGNRMPMNIINNNKIENVFADVNPQMKSFNFYDEKGDKLFIKNENAQEQKTDNKAEAKIETQPEIEQKPRGVKM